MNRALLVGINSYPSAPLRGCVNDVVDMAQFLVASCGFTDADIRLLVDDRATTEAIRERLTWLVNGARAGDRLFFHYSGHGTILPLRSSTGNVTEQHDAICPVDFDFTPEHALTDDDFKEIFVGVPSDVEFNWLSDSCHSGDLTKALFAPNQRSKSFPMPADIAWRLRTARQAGVVSRGLPRAIEHLRGAFISGLFAEVSG